MVLGFANCEKGDNGTINNDNNNDNGDSSITFDVSGTIAGHDYVDLVLPSCTKWATCNVGVNQPYDYGDYYVWGEIIAKSNYSGENCPNLGISMNDISGNIQYDAATANWGDTWRMSTKTEMEELIDNCTWTWTTQRGVNGYKATGPNGNSIFLPAAGYYFDMSHYSIEDYGYYWISVPYDSNDYDAFNFSFSSGSYYVSWDLRYYGHPIRQVSD